ncbi:MAG TPA: DNA polymerase [Candidatus Paceibacterota bacterium]
MVNKAKQTEKGQEREIKRLVLLDSHAILHRAYHALPDFSSKKGEPTGALYGLTAMLIKIIEELKPDYLVACYDLPGPTYRHDVYKEYKAQRKKMDDDLAVQINRSRDIFKAFDVPIYDKAGFEADDMLGTIVEKVKDNTSIQVVIASGDMDTLQLVKDDKVLVYTLKKGIRDTILYDEKAVKSRFGFGPELLPDYKGLRGDPSDNIIGIAGIGEKTATILITKFGSIENIYKELERGMSAGGDKKIDKGKQKKEIKVKNEINRKDKKKEKDTEKIKEENLSNDDYGEFKKVGISPRIIELLKNGKEEAEFSKMLATIRRDAQIYFTLPEKEFRENIDIDKILTLFNNLEFRTLGARLKNVLGVKTASMGLDSEENISGNKKGENIDKDDKKDGSANKKVDENKSKNEAVNQKMDENTNETVNQYQFKRISIAIWLLDSDRTEIDLEGIYEFTSTNNLSDAEKMILTELDKKGLRKVYEDIELPLISVIEKMEKRGVKIDTGFLVELSKKYHTELSKLEKKIWEFAGVEFNINSPRQLGEILFDRLALTAKNLKKTEGGARSTRESELEKLRDAHPIVPLLFDYRELQKLLSTYIDVIPSMTDENGRLHAHFIQTGAVTGRMASQNPGLQNIPIKTELGRAIRKAFIAEKGFSIVALDYSQIELRIAAFMSYDEKLIEIFKNGIDVHNAVASEVFEVPLEKVDREMRRRAKVINFGILYGMGVNALKQNLGTERAEAQLFYNNYFKKFSGLAKYLNEIKAEVERNGYTETFFGRRRYFEGINSKIPYIKAMFERMAINAPFQGTSADIIKIAMKRIDMYLQKEGYDKTNRQDAFLILQVHDELVYEIRENLVEKIAPEIKKIMESVIDPKDIKGITCEVNYSVGKNWGELK